MRVIYGLKLADEGSFFFNIPNTFDYPRKSGVGSQNSKMAGLNSYKTSILKFLDIGTFRISGTMVVLVDLVRKILLGSNQNQ